MHTLEIRNFGVKIEDKQILNNINLTIKSGEVHAIMGPNGTGKSTLASAIMGAPAYEVTSGEVLLDGQNILEMSVDERARQGIFLAMQNPVEVPGVTNSSFMREALSAKVGKRVNLIDFALDYEEKSKELEMREDLPHRYLNQGFSGGEKKRNEVLQLKVLQPKFAMLDEIDSGLDVDALKIVGTNISEMIGPNMGILLITHYQRIFDYIKPTFIHVIVDGAIVKTGGMEIIKEIEESGYANFNGDNK
ncbi:MAG: Fe-S cluster assembly ATPase SufC [Acholeplasmataceae bacterium]|jgi:Fe-S cluster assembly ATP-binding protein